MIYNQTVTPVKDCTLYMHIYPYICSGFFSIRLDMKGSIDIEWSMICLETIFT